MHSSPTSVTTKTLGDGLPHPPRCIRGKRESLGECEPLDRDSKSMLPKLNPLLRRKTGSGILLGDSGNYPTMGGHQLYLGFPIAVLSLSYQRNGL